MKDDIYHYQEKPEIETRALFKFTIEANGLRVSNKTVNCLYLGQMNESDFHLYYNEFHRFFNPNLEALNGSKLLGIEDFEIIEQDLITSWIRFYALYGMEVKVRREDFVHYNTVDAIQSHFVKKGLTKAEAINTGSSLLRMDQKEYFETVEYLEWYHSMK